MNAKLGVRYVNVETGHLKVVIAFHFESVHNPRVRVRNLTTGQDETWTQRLFLAEHHEANES